MLIENIKKELFYTLLFILALNSNNYSQDSLYILVFPSHKEINPKINCNVSVDNSNYQFTYSITNNLSSLQKINHIKIEIETNVTQIVQPTNWKGSQKHNTLKTVSWYTTDSLFFISPNSSKNYYSYNSSGLPYISNIYIYEVMLHQWLLVKTQIQ